MHHLTFHTLLANTSSFFPVVLKIGMSSLFRFYRLLNVSRIVILDSQPLYAPGTYPLAGSWWATSFGMGEWGARKWAWTLEWTCVRKLKNPPHLYIWPTRKRDPIIHFCCQYKLVLFTHTQKKKTFFSRTAVCILIKNNWVWCTTLRTKAWKRGPLRT